jgi:hemerythrin
VAFLREYVIVHFAAEERLMHEQGYPGYDDHVAEHRAFSARLRAMDEAFRAAGPTAALVHRLEREAVGWLHDHVYFTDVALGRFVKARARAPQAAAVLT